MISRSPFSNINYSVILVSIITGPLFPELRSGVSGSQVTSGTGERFGLEPGQPYWCCPSRNIEKTTRFPNRHLVQSSTTGCSGHHSQDPECCLEGRSPKKLSLPREHIPSFAPQRGTGTVSPAVRVEKQEEPDPTSRKGISGLCSQYCQGRTETQDSSITWEGPCSQGTEEGTLLFLFPLQGPESIAICSVVSTIK